MGSVHVQGEFGWDDVVCFGTLLLLVHLPDGRHLVDTLVKHYHGFKLAVSDLLIGTSLKGNLVELPAENAPHVAADDYHVVVIEVLPRGLPLVEEAREGVGSLQNKRLPHKQLM